MSVLYVGDTHDYLQAFMSVEKYCVDNGINTVVQVGDCGVRFAAAASVRYFEKRERQERPGPTWYTCGGNHDNYDRWEKLREAQGAFDLTGKHKLTELAPRVYWVARGGLLTLHNKVHLFLGGAESTDKMWRTEGKSWWRQETPTGAEFQLFADRLRENKPDVVVTHDVPLCVFYDRNGREDAPTPRNLTSALQASEYKPPLWVYGHHHELCINEIEGTKYVCCGLNGQWWSEETGFGGIDVSITKR
jgi:predicted phosphodiesterase